MSSMHNNCCNSLGMVNCLIHFDRQSSLLLLLVKQHKELLRLRIRQIGEWSD